MHLNSNFNEKLVLCGPTVSKRPFLHFKLKDSDPRFAKQNMETILQKTPVSSNVIEQLSKHSPITICVRPQML